MTLSRKALLLLLMLCTLCHWVISQQPPAYDADLAFMEARKIAFEGDRIQARYSLQQILQDYPQYTDAEVLLAKTYSWDGNYDEARKRLNRMTSTEKPSRAMWLAAVKNEIYANNLNIALGLANKALKHLGNDTEIEELKRKIIDDIEQSQLIHNILKKEKRETHLKNTLSMASAVEVFDLIFEPMYYSTVEYQRTTTIGTILPRINYSERFDIRGVQYETELYPTITEKVYGYFNYGFSDAITYPKHKAAAELYLALPKSFEASLGARYLAFQDDDASIFTGSFGMYRGNYYLSLRPYVTRQDNGETGFSGNALIRKYLKNGYNYLGLRLGYGFDAEVNQFTSDGVLLAETLLYIESQRLQLEYQFSDSNDVNIYRASIGLRRQEIAFDPGAFFWAATIGFQYQIRF
ncbi:MAG: YaiO family outer membrane beta-barrel protein [Bacteroidota bacterium]